MPCLVAGIAFFFPRVAIILLVIFSDYIDQAYGTWVWPLLGFFVLPYTTLVYAWAINTHGSMNGLYVIALVIAILADLGAIGGGAHAERTRTRVR